MTPKEKAKQLVKKPVRLSQNWLNDCGFVKDNNGNYWIDLQTHYLELTHANGYWYPVICQVPEMSHEDEQRVSMNRIEFVCELQNLFFAITGKELLVDLSRYHLNVENSINNI